MRTNAIVVLSPGSDHFSCVLLTPEPGLVQTLLTELAVEALHEGVLIESLLQLPNGYQVAVLKVSDEDGAFADLLSLWRAAERRITPLGLHHSDDSYVSIPPPDVLVQPIDRVVLYGRGKDLEAASG